LLRYAPPRLRAAKPSETLAPGAESTYNNNQPNGDLSELTKKRLPLAPLSAPPLWDCPEVLYFFLLGGFIGCCLLALQLQRTPFCFSWPPRKEFPIFIPSGKQEFESPTRTSWPQAFRHEKYADQRSQRSSSSHSSSRSKGGLIPESAAEEIIGELQALFARHNAGAALSAKAVFKPTKEFHSARHTMYSAEENMEIDKVVPVAASVKTKLGRGGAGEE